MSIWICAHCAKLSAVRNAMFGSLELRSWRKKVDYCATHPNICLYAEIPFANKTQSGILTGLNAATTTHSHAQAKTPKFLHLPYFISVSWGWVEQQTLWPQVQNFNHFWLHAFETSWWLDAPIVNFIAWLLDLPPPFIWTFKNLTNTLECFAYADQHTHTPFFGFICESTKLPCNMEVQNISKRNWMSIYRLDCITFKLITFLEDIFVPPKPNDTIQKDWFLTWETICRETHGNRFVQQASLTYCVSRPKTLWWKCRDGWEWNGRKVCVLMPPVEMRWHGDICQGFATIKMCWASWKNRKFELERGFFTMVCFKTGGPVLYRNHLSGKG